jgi:hypothetical protein
VLQDSASLEVLVGEQRDRVEDLHVRTPVVTDEVCEM